MAASLWESWAGRQCPLQAAWQPAAGQDGRVGGPSLTTTPVLIADTIPEDFQEFQSQSFDRLDN